MKARDLSSEIIESCLIFYAKQFIPGIFHSSRKPSSSTIPSENEQRELIETVIANLLQEKTSWSSTATRILFGLLRTANILNASEECKAALEKKIGSQLEQATLDDLLIPSYSYLNETLYDVDCVERILGYFLDGFKKRSASRIKGEDENSGVRSAPLMLVGKLIDGYLSEITSDVNLKPKKFYKLAVALPDHARLFNDGLYGAIDVYLKAHPWRTKEEWDKISSLRRIHRGVHRHRPKRAASAESGGSGSYATFSYSDIIILTHFIRDSPLNIAGIIMLVMNARKTKSSANLTFGLLLTRVFEHFHVPLPTSTSECIPLPSHHVLDETSLRRAGFVLRSDLTSDTVLLERVTAIDASHTHSVSAPAPTSIPPPSPAPEIPSATPSAPSSSIPPPPPPPPPPTSTQFIPPLILESQTTLTASVAANHTVLLHELAALQQSVQHSSAQLFSNRIDFHNLLNDLTVNFSSLPLNHTPLLDSLTRMQHDLQRQQDAAIQAHRRQAYLTTSILTEQNRYLAHQIFDQAHGFRVTRPDIFPSRHTGTDREEWFFNPHLPYNPSPPRSPRVVEVVEVPTTTPPPADPSSSVQGAHRSAPLPADPSSSTQDNPSKEIANKLGNDYSRPILKVLFEHHIIRID
ncbi:hypothetical protein RJ639_018823 [Escallonia herrerae]|uniref:NPH3 domain-containing protein n=1 Tax=Escallonia herrerae TaxID=1293975 RepID=A0AA88V7N5_9ASTE|nr:hypothetical protein RJ639_018823 [Escallonia herrerae]